MQRSAPLVAVLLALGSGQAAAQIAVPDVNSKAPAQTYRPPAAAPIQPYRPPAAAPTTPPPWSAPAVVPAVPGPAGAIGGNDAAALQAERSLPLDPGTRNLQNQLPPDPQAVQRQLGLRTPVGPVTDLRGHTPSAQEIANGLNRR